MATDVIARVQDLSQNDLLYRSQSELRTWREELRTNQTEAYQRMERMSDAARGRPLTTSQRSDFDAAERQVSTASQLLEAIENALIHKVIASQPMHQPSTEVDTRGVVWSNPDPFGPMWLADAPTPREFVVGSNAEYRTDRPLTRGQTTTGFTRALGMVRPGDDELNLGRYLQGMCTGQWPAGAEQERRALSEGVQSAGGFLVPTILSAQLIDLARVETQVIAAGAQLMPMANQVVDIAKWTGDPGNAWHTELGTITPSDATMGRVRFTARTLATITQVSMELLQDAPNVGNELATSFAKSFAIRVDKAALYGTGTAPEPLGLKNTSGITVQSMGANGSVMNSYDPFVDAVGTLEDLNEDATGGIIVAPRTVRELNKLKDTTGQPLRNPPVLDGLPFLTTNQIPTNLTQGTATTATTASDAFVGDWTKLIIGVRAELVIQPLRERYADTGAIGFLSWWRGDIQLARPAAFVNIVGIL